MQTEKSQPEGKRIMPETRLTEFSALSVDPIGPHWRPMIQYFSYLLLNKIVCFLDFFYNLRCKAADSERHSRFFVTARRCRL